MNSETGRWVRRLTVLNQYGIYGRPAVLFVKTASGFLADIQVSKAGNTVSGKSIMGLLTLEAEQGSTLTISAEGPDARELIEALTVLINAGFHCDEPCLPIPEKHSTWDPEPPQ